MCVLAVFKMVIGFPRNGEFKQVYILLFFCATLFVINHLYPSYLTNNSSGGLHANNHLSKELPCRDSDGPSFWASGLAAGTDKVSKAFNTVLWKGEKFPTHTFQFAYEKYLRPRRCQQLRLLEIGLGCGFSPWKMGSSVLLWLHFLPNALVSSFEFNKECATAFRTNFPFPLDAQKRSRFQEMFIGDQSNPADFEQLDRFAPYDVIIDDGGHSMRMQITSLEELMPRVAPGGIYILEDLETSFSSAGSWPDYLDGPGGLTTMVYVTNLIMAITSPKHIETLDPRFAGLRRLVSLIKSVDCFREICVFTRFADGEWPVAEAPLFPEGIYSFPRLPK